MSLKAFYSAKDLNDLNTFLNNLYIYLEALNIHLIQDHLLI